LIYAVRHRSGFFETTPCYLIIDRHRDQLLLLPCQAPFHLHFHLHREALVAVTLSAHQHLVACHLFTEKETYSLLFASDVSQEEVLRELRAFGSPALKIEAY